jgi:tRNA-specific 2-thiouridylase
VPVFASWSTKVVLCNKEASAKVPWFVADKRLESNELLVVQGDNPRLYHQSLSASNPHWITATPTFPLKCMAKIRYRPKIQKNYAHQ